MQAVREQLMEAFYGFVLGISVIWLAWALVRAWKRHRR